MAGHASTFSAVRMLILTIPKCMISSLAVAKDPELSWCNVSGRSGEDLHRHIMFYLYNTNTIENNFTKNTRDPNLLDTTRPILHDAWWFLARAGQLRLGIPRKQIGSAVLPDLDTTNT